MLRCFVIFAPRHYRSMNIADTDPTPICCLILPSKIIRYGCEGQDLHGGIHSRFWPLQSRILRCEQADCAEHGSAYWHPSTAKSEKRPQAFYRVHGGRRGVLHYWGHDVWAARSSTNSATGGCDCAGRAVPCCPSEAACSWFKASDHSRASESLGEEGQPYAANAVSSSLGCGSTG
jgi:hypothetical protein